MPNDRLLSETVRDCLKEPVSSSSLVWDVLAFVEL